MSIIAAQLVFIGVLLVLSALCSATEVAYTGLNLSQIKRINRIKPGAVEIWEKHPDRILATILLSNNAVNIAMGVISASMAAKVGYLLGVRQSLAILIFGFLLGTIVLIFGEIVPKTLARHYSIPWALFITPFMQRWTKIVDPLSRAAAKFTNYLLIGFRKRPETPYLQEQELKQILENAALPSHSKKILDNLLEFSSTKVRDIMVARNDMLAIANDLPMEKIIRSVLVSGFSRIPVYSGTLNRMVGILYAKDLLLALRTSTLINLDDVLRPLHFVEPDLPLSALLRLFKTGHHHMALVRRGEDGPIEGLVTLQDALESIVGDIHEEI